MVPRPFTIRRVIRETHDTVTLHLSDSSNGGGFGFAPGQFNMIYLFGVGEVAISISGDPTRPDALAHTVRAVGTVTEPLAAQKRGASLGVRGPYGNGFPVQDIIGKDVLFVAGGLGMAPLRSLVWYVLDNREKVNNITLMYGAKTPADMLFREELLSLIDRTDLTCLLTVDADPGGTWKNYIGLLPKLFDQAKIDPPRTYAAVCGPPVVYKFVLARLLALGFAKDRILMSLERRMKCGVGKCGHCNIGYKYTCLHGPIFTYWDAINLPEMI